MFRASLLPRTKKHGRLKTLFVFSSFFSPLSTRIIARGFILKKSETFPRVRTQSKGGEPQIRLNPKHRSLLTFKTLSNFFLRRVTQQNQQNSTTTTLSKSVPSVCLRREDRRQTGRGGRERERVSFFPLRAALCFFFWERYNTDGERERHISVEPPPPRTKKKRIEKKKKKKKKKSEERESFEDKE